ncbi:MAG: type I restriction enzyme HsdR N-terminal domain-containing protein [Fluviicola sp.]|nr:type I restriction enzyme HsdR N-terminal domain-containing protein [Fluviicola sp.]
MFPALQLPKANLRLSQKEGQYFVWCDVRKKQLKLTPEEWVRQHAMHFLIHQKGISIGRISAEHLLKINKQNRRCDILVIDQQGKAVLIVECKAPEITIDEKTFLQTSNYVRETGAQFFWMTNGLQHVVMDCMNGTFIEELPEM